MDRVQRWRIAVGVLSVCLLIGCGAIPPVDTTGAPPPEHAADALSPAAASPASARETPTPQVTVIERSDGAVEIIVPPGASGVAADCGWDSETYTWIDSDVDGVRDANERPLAGVTFVITDTVSGIVRHTNATEATGYRQGFSLLGGCPEVPFLIAPDIPDGYRLTTPATVTSAYPQTEAGPFLFGFVPSAE